MTLATETIKQWRSDAENIARRSCEYETEYSAAEAILALTAELLANREAQPVAWLAIYHGEVYDEAISIARSVVEAQAERFGWESALTEIIPLYRHTPPAPAVPDEKPKFDYNPSMSWGDQCVAIAEIRGWNACRAAMLAAAPEGGN